MKKYYSALLFLGLTAGLFSACNNDEEDQIAPEVTIEHDGTSTSCAPETVFNFKAKTNTPSVSLFWTIDGKRASVDADYQYTAYELGVREIIVKASNSLGEAADTVYLNVHSSTAGKVNSLNNIVNWTGEEGSNRAALAIQWVSGDVEDVRYPEDNQIFFRTWGYRWKAGETKTGEDMIRAIAAHDPRLFVILTKSDWGTSATGFIYDGNGDGQFQISNTTQNLTQADFTNGIYENTPDGNFDGITVSEGDYWIGGFMDTFTCYWNQNAETISDEELFESQIMMNQRVLENNSWDVWSWTLYDVQNPINPLPSIHLLQAAEANQ